MKKVELLAPAGDMESLYQAVQNGCDAVYLSGTSFGARKFAPNFDRDQLKSATEYCHLFGVSIYVTVNTLIHDTEFENLTDYIDFLYQIGVDALIMQDLGAIRLVRERYPDFEIHASTQLHNHNVDDLKLLKEMGVRRCVVARELSVEEIESLGDILELEIFIHGALCIAYSGQCLMSSMILDRSGNRGACAGFCRLPYKLIEDGKEIVTANPYLLSPRDLNTTSKIDTLLKIPAVVSFKIEGRMKSPAYVGFVTGLYRKLMDHCLQNQSPVVSSEEQKQLEVLYNRKFTLGHLFHQTKDDLMNPESPNHIGISLGQVIATSPSKIKIKLTEVLRQGDGIRFPNGEGMIVNFLYDSKGKLIACGNPSEVVMLDNKVGLSSLGEVRKTLDQTLLTELQKLPHRTIPITGHLVALVDQPLTLTLEDGIHRVVVTGKKVASARTAPLTEEQFIRQLTKTKDTPFTFEQIQVDTDHAFVPIKDINALRREAITRLIEVRTKSLHTAKPKEPSKLTFVSDLAPFSINVSVQNKEQYDAAQACGVDRIYVGDFALYQKEKAKGNVYYRLDRVISHYPSLSNERLLIGEIGGLFYTSSNTVITDYFCNAYNAQTVAFLLTRGVSQVTLSVELKKEEIASLVDHFKTLYQQLPSIQVLVYGRIELMRLKHCPITTTIKPKEKCALCQKHRYQLEDRNGKRYPLQSNCPFTTIFHHQITNRLNEIPFYQSLGITQYRLDFLEETKEEVLTVIQTLQKNIMNSRS